VYITTPHKRKCFRSTPVETYTAYINVFPPSCMLMKTMNFLNTS